MTRTYLDFNTIDDCCRGLCLIFEQHLRREQHLQDSESVEYQLGELIEFIDKIGDLTCMVYNDTQKVYLPHSMDWLKSQLYSSLKKHAIKIPP